MNPLRSEIGAMAADSLDLICPNCGSRDVATILRAHQFPYKDGEESISITAMVPFRSCQACELEYLDSDAEDLMHEAVCRHLRVLAPSEIRAIRDQAEMSRAEFARLTRFGDASLARWERGSVVQNGGNDQLLYLLSYRDNIRRLRLREQQVADAHTEQFRGFHYQRLSPTPEVQSHSEAFRLRPHPKRIAL